MNYQIESLKRSLLLKGHQTKLIFDKHSPEILMGAGIVGVVGATVLACKATLEAQETYQTVSIMMTGFEQSKDKPDNDPKEITKIQTQLVITGAIEILKLYLPALAVGGLSIGAILRSRSILNKRNAGLAAAFKLATEAYERYRERVVDEFGEDVDLYLRTIRNEDDERELEAVVRDKNGRRKEFKLTEEEANMVSYGASQYAKFFDDSSPQWRPTNEANVFFLKSQQTHMNVLLQSRGHVFLNDVYDALGIPRTTAGAVVGWVKDHGDDVIDFGIFDPANDYNADFVNGYNRDSILLDFNVDGLIYELI